MTSASGFVGTPAEARSLFRTLQQQDRRNGQREQHEKNAGLGVASLVAFDGEHLAPGTEAGTEAAVKATRETEAEAKATTTKRSDGNGRVMGTKSDGKRERKGRRREMWKRKWQRLPEKWRNCSLGETTLRKRCPAWSSRRYTSVTVPEASTEGRRSTPSARRCRPGTRPEDSVPRRCAAPGTWRASNAPGAGWPRAASVGTAPRRNGVGGAERRVEAAFRHYDRWNIFWRITPGSSPRAFPCGAQCGLLLALLCGALLGRAPEGRHAPRWATDPKL
jgi:hypothetical protein